MMTSFSVCHDAVLQVIDALDAAIDTEGISRVTGVDRLDVARILTMRTDAIEYVNDPIRVAARWGQIDGTSTLETTANLLKEARRCYRKLILICHSQHWAEATRPDSIEGYFESLSGLATYLGTSLEAVAISLTIFGEATSTNR